MSRLDEVDIAIYDEGTTPTGYWADVLALCRTLAAEVDELRGKLSEYESECYALRAVTAEKNSDILRKRVKASDAVITKLLAMLKTTHSKARYTDLRIRQLYEQACEIAGRTE